MFKVFLDMDGVLVDFVNGACELHKKPNPYPQHGGEYNILDLLEMSEKDFFKGMNYDFWIRLQPMPDMGNILHIVENTFQPQDIYICTQPCLTEGCLEGKKAWIDGYMPRYTNRLIFIRHKFLLAKRNHILIDDSPKHCNEFEQYGGQVIPVPRPWNPLLDKDPIESIRFKIELILSKDKR